MNSRTMDLMVYNLDANHYHLQSGDIYAVIDSASIFSFGYSICSGCRVLGRHQGPPVYPGRSPGTRQSKSEAGGPAGKIRA